MNNFFFFVCVAIVLVLCGCADQRESGEPDTPPNYHILHSDSIKAMASGDYNGDGLIDIAVGGYDGIDIYLNEGWK